MIRTFLPFAATAGLTTSAVVSHNTLAVTLAVGLLGGGVVLGVVVLLLLAVASVWSSQPERRKNAFKVLDRFLSFVREVIRPQPPQATGQTRRRRRVTPGDQ
ncbi:hypothetical protein [Streptomyces roseifaciens]|uniref:hypothetical protein n=1 Tax=Streptomyces roseifaciens TaxID=1488406 RepID=UPI0007182084|nr:hypothetical protein [Streptomyces roseifaciens]